MKKILVLSFASLKDSSLCNELEEEFSRRELFRGKSLSYTHFKKEVNQFDLPVGSPCILSYGDNSEESLVFNVERYSVEVNKDFSVQTNFVYLNFRNFCGCNSKKLLTILKKNGGFLNR